MPDDDGGPSDLSAAPQQHVRELRGRIGSSAAASRCVDLLRGGHTDASMLWLGGLAAQRFVGVDDLGVNAYWPRTWGARGLLYCWDPSAGSAVVDGLGDEAWRVREMCAKVVRLRELGVAADPVTALVRDDVPRVRTAALRALAMIGEGEHAVVVRTALDDAAPVVRRAAAQAMEALSRRLDRPL